MGAAGCGVGESYSLEKNGRFTVSNCGRIKRNVKESQEKAEAGTRKVKADKTGL